MLFTITWSARGTLFKKLFALNLKTSVTCCLLEPLVLTCLTLGLCFRNKGEAAKRKEGEMLK